MTLVGTLGFEIECAVNYDRDIAFKALCNEYNFDIGTDGSVHSIEGKCYEIRSPVYKIAPRFLVKIRNQLKALASHMIGINDSMGFHVHMKFNDIGIQQKLCEYETVQEFVKLYAKTFTKPAEKQRLNSDYCISTYGKEKWLKDGFLQKYLAINSNHAYREHKTVEFRIFPMNKDHLALINYIKFALAFVEQTQKELEQKPEGFEVNRKTLVFKEDREKIELEVEKELKEQEKETVCCPFCGRDYCNGN